MKKRFGFKRGFCLVVLGAILMAVLPGVPGVGSGAVVLAQKGKGNKGKPPKEPVKRYEVRYLDPADGQPPFNFIPDGKGLFLQGLPVCVLPCPYVDGKNDSTIYEQDGLFKQLQERDQDLYDIYGDIYEKPHYRHFETDIEWQAMEANDGDGLCPSLLDRDSDWTLGGSFSYDDELFQKILFSLWVDVWPDAGPSPSWSTSTGWARVAGAIPVDDPPVWDDFDLDGVFEELLTRVSPHWELVWDEQEHDGSTNLEITELEPGTFLVVSPGKAMLRVKRRNGGRYRNCGLVYARFEFVATPIFP